MLPHSLLAATSLPVIHSCSLSLKWLLQLSGAVLIASLFQLAT